MSEPKDYQKKMEDQLNRMADRIDDLLAHAEAGVRKGLEHLPDQLEATRIRFNELKKEGGAAWEDVKPGLEKAWNELRDSFETAASRFRKND